jgi:hypothetical protein
MDIDQTDLENEFDIQDFDINNEDNYTDNNDKIHDIIYETTFAIKSYINDNCLPIFENFQYSDFFNLIENQIKF